MKALRKAFTLVEVMVVIAIIGVLIALLLPAIQKVRERANRTRCSSNLRQLGIASHAYHDLTGYLPMHVGPGDWSAFRDLLPFVEQTALYKQCAGGLSGSTGSTSAWVPAYVCPSDTFAVVTTVGGGAPLPPATAMPREIDVDPPGGGGGDPPVTYSPSTYACLLGSLEPAAATAWPQWLAVSNVSDGLILCKSGNNFVRIADVLDGMNNTLMIAENRSDPTRITTWACANGGVAVSTFYYPNANPGGMNSPHSGVAQLGFGDGSVRAMDIRNMDANSLTVLRQLSTRAGGENPQLP